MSEWREYKISEFAEVIAGGTPSTKEPAYYGGNISWITPKDLTNFPDRCIRRGERNITEAGLKNSSARLLPPETILLTSRAPIGYLAIAKNHLATNQGFKNLVVDKSKADPFFVYYLLKANIEYIKSQGSGTTFAEISGAVTKELKFKLPDVPTQKAIAEILSSLDDKIELNNQINSNLEALAQAIFEDVFAQADCDRLVTIEHFVDFNPAVKIKKGSPTTFVEMKFLPTNGMNVTAVDQKPFTAGSRFMQNDTLLARITPCLENGKTAFVNFLGDNESGFGSTEFIVMRAKTTACPQFVYCLARNQQFRTHAIGSMVGSSGRQRVQQDMLVKFTVPLVDSEEMNKFYQATEPLFLQINANRVETAELIKLRDLLLPKLVTGHISVE